LAATEPNARVMIAKQIKFRFLKRNIIYLWVWWGF
jgi:hypothetical protein